MLTAPGAVLEMERKVLNGRAVRVWKNASRPMSRDRPAVTPRPHVQDRIAVTDISAHGHSETSCLTRNANTPSGRSSPRPSEIPEKPSRFRMCLTAPRFSQRGCGQGVLVSAQR